MGFIYVAIGGAIGAMGRYAISLIPFKAGFPVLTLVTNVLGAVLIGFITGVAVGRGDASRNAILFWTTGVCGGFTTFSTFSLESYSLWISESYFLCGLYIILSVVFCIVGILCGRRLAGLV